MEDKQPLSTATRNGEEVRRSRRLRRIIPPIIGVLVMVLIIVYVVSLLFSRYGSFTISVKDNTDKKYSLILSENENFRRTSAKLTATAAKNITNISGNSLPNTLNDTNGAHNGENYLAYTFYVKNTGEAACRYRYNLVITRATLGIDSAARIRVYYNPEFYKAASDSYNYSGDYTDYAKPKTGGNGEPEIDPPDKVMTNFHSEDIIVQNEIDNFEVGDIGKITVVIWLEGDDPDCVDDILGGQLKVDMTLEIIGGTEEK